MAAKPLVTVADQNFFAASIEKELVARTAWAAKFKHLLDRPIRKSEFRPFQLPSIPCEPKDQTGKYAVKRINYDKQHLDMIDKLLGDRKDTPLLPVMYPRSKKEKDILAGDKKELLPEIRKMRDNKTEYYDRFRDYGVGEKVFRTFVTKADASDTAAATTASTAAATATTTGSGSSEEKEDLLSKDKDENLIDERAKVKEKSRGGGKGGGGNSGGCGGRMAGVKRRGNEGSNAKAAEVTVAAARKAAEATAAAGVSASPVSLEGNPRTQYLKERNIKAPDEKFLFTVTEQQRYGWNLALEMPPEKIHGSKFARIQVLESECFRDNCIQYPPDHLDTPGKTMADNRNNPGDSKTHRGIAFEGKW